MPVSIFNRLPAKGRVYRFQDLIFWAQGGWVCVEDTGMDGDFRNLHSAEFAARVVAFLRRNPGADRVHQPIELCRIEIAEHLNVLVDIGLVLHQHTIIVDGVIRNRRLVARGYGFGLARIDDLLKADSSRPQLCRFHWRPFPLQHHGYYEHDADHDGE